MQSLEHSSLVDFDLILDDGESMKYMPVNKSVLTNLSTYFDYMLDELYFSFVWTLPFGYIHAAETIITYMYTPSLKTLKTLMMDVNIKHMQYLCLQLKMPILHNLISEIQYKRQNIDIRTDKKKCSRDHMDNDEDNDKDNDNDNDNYIDNEIGIRSRYRTRNDKGKLKKKYISRYRRNIMKSNYTSSLSRIDENY
jgi:hypothetical protein